MSPVPGHFPFCRSSRCCAQGCFVPPPVHLPPLWSFPPRHHVRHLHPALFVRLLSKIVDDGKLRTGQWYCTRTSESNFSFSYLICFTHVRCFLTFSTFLAKSALFLCMLRIFSPRFVRLCNREPERFAAGRERSIWSWWHALADNFFEMACDRLREWVPSKDRSLPLAFLVHVLVLLVFAIPVTTAFAHQEWPPFQGCFSWLSKLTPTSFHRTISVEQLNALTPVSSQEDFKCSCKSATAFKTADVLAPLGDREVGLQQSCEVHLDPFMWLPSHQLEPSPCNSVAPPTWTVQLGGGTNGKSGRGLGRTRSAVCPQERETEASLRCLNEARVPVKDGVASDLSVSKVCASHMLERNVWLWTWHRVAKLHLHEGRKAGARRSHRPGVAVRCSEVAAQDFRGVGRKAAGRVEDGVANAQET